MRTKYFQLFGLPAQPEVLWMSDLLVCLSICKTIFSGLFHYFCMVLHEVKVEWVLKSDEALLWEKLFLCPKWGKWGPELTFLDFSPDGKDLKVGESNHFGFLRKFFIVPKIGKISHLYDQNQHVNFPLNLFVRFFWN